MYIVVALMLLVAREDIDGFRVKDRFEPEQWREWII